MKKKDWRGLCSDVLLVTGIAAFVVGGFLLGLTVGVFALGAALVAMAVLVQRQGGDGE